MPRGAPTLVARDDTPLNGPRIDVAARIGWLLRTARRSAGPGAPSMQALADRNGVTLARMQRVEIGTLRSGAVASDYERALDLREGSLRAPIDILCRTFPYAPPERDAGEPVTSFREVSRLTDLVSGEDVEGGAWLAWARALGQPGAIGMHAAQVTTLTDCLVGEMNRSTGSAYTTRYDALAVLRSSEYGDVVVEVARARIADPHVQVLLDMMSAVGERVTPDCVAWCLELLWDARPRVVTGAVLALENMGEISGDPVFWDAVVAPAMERYDALRDPLDTDETEIWVWLSQLLRLVPRTRLHAQRRRPARALAPASGDQVSTGTQAEQARTRHWASSEQIASGVCERFEMPAQPMLSRLIYDIAYGPFETRAVTSVMLLSGLPGWSLAVADGIADAFDAEPDAVVRVRMARRMIGLVQDGVPAAALAWADAPDPAVRAHALRLAGTAGVRLPEATLDRAMADGVVGPVVFAAGHSGHPYLDRLAASDDPQVAGAARWWQREGGRVTI